MHSDDYEKAKGGLLAADLSSQAKWQLTGSDRVRYLNGQSTCDVTRLAQGKSTWAAVTSIKGKLEGDLRVASASDRLLADADPALSESLFNRLSKYIIADDVELSDVSADWKLFHLISNGLATPKVPEIPGQLVIESDRFGMPGLDVWIPASANEILPCASPETWEIIRIENGIPRWGVDMDSTNLAPEMPFEKRGALSYGKGCYIGQEVIARIKSIGHVNKQLCVLHSKENIDLVLPAPCTFEGKNTGMATSSCRSPGLGGTYALAIVSRQQATAGSSLEIQGKSFTVLS